MTEGDTSDKKNQLQPGILSMYPGADGYPSNEGHSQRVESPQDSGLKTERSDSGDRLPSEAPLYDGERARQIQADKDRERRVPEGGIYDGRRTSMRPPWLKEVTGVDYEPTTGPDDPDGVISSQTPDPNAISTEVPTAKDVKTKGAGSFLEQPDST